MADTDAAEINKQKKKDPKAETKSEYFKKLRTEFSYITNTSAKRNRYPIVPHCVYHNSITH